MTRSFVNQYTAVVGTNQVVGTPVILNPNTTYYYRVRALCSNGTYSEYSNTTSVTTGGATSSTWTGTGIWTSASNWSNGVPDAGTDVIIASGECTVTGAAACKSLYINEGGALTINTSVTLTVTNEPAILESVSTSAAPGSLIVNGTLSVAGNTTGTQVKVQRAITGNNSVVHLVSAPLTGTYYRCLPGTGVGWKYNSLTAAWDTIASGGTFASGIGYRIKLTSGGTANFLGGTFATPPTIGLNTNTNFNWNLLGNPYTSALNWESGSITKTNTYNTIYMWNGTSYGVYSGSDGIPTVTTSGATQYVPAMQGFFVRAKGAGASVTLGKGAQVHSSQSYYRTAEQTTNILRLITDGNGTRDEAVVRFLAPATTLFDENMDAIKMFSDLETVGQIYTESAQNEPMVINTLPEVYNVNVPVAFKAGVDGSYTIFVDGLNSLTENVYTYLIDKKQNVTIDLSAQSSYTFDYSTSDQPGRFELKVMTSPMTDIKTVDSKDYSVAIFAADGKINVRNNGNQALKGQVVVYDILGKEITRATLTNGNLTVVNMNSITGTYIVKVITDNKVYSSKVFVR